MVLTSKIDAPLSPREQLEREIDEVVVIMHQNVNKVLERGDNLDSANERADNLIRGSEQ